MPIPVIDERVRYVGATALRGLNAKTLRELKDVLVVQVDEKPVTVVIPYAIYMEMQAAVWPSSLLPALENFLAQSDVERLTDDGTNPPSAPETADTRSPAPNPSHSDWGVDGFGSKSHGEMPTLPSPLTALGTDMTPRGGKFPRTDDSQPPVIDDIDESSPSSSAEMEIPCGSDLYRYIVREDQPEWAEPQCGHCGKSNDTVLCSECFLAGHRGGDCLVCAEGTRTI